MLFLSEGVCIQQSEFVGGMQCLQNASSKLTKLFLAECPYFQFSSRKDCNKRKWAFRHILTVHSWIIVLRGKLVMKATVLVVICLLYFMKIWDCIFLNSTFVACVRIFSPRRKPFCIMELFGLSHCLWEALWRLETCKSCQSWGFRHGLIFSACLGSMWHVKTFLDWYMVLGLGCGAGGPCHFYGESFCTFLEVLFHLFLMIRWECGQNWLASF